MANPEHIAMIYEGVEEWNRWRATARIRPDLRHAPLSEMSLAGYNFAGADCEGANFENSDLSACEFAGANLCYANLRAAQVKGVLLSDISFFRADLREVSFSAATIDNVNFFEANLECALFRSAHIRFCDFTGAKLQGADFANSSFFQVNLSKADIRSANFSGASLGKVDLNNVWLSETRMTDWKLVNIYCNSIKLGRDGTTSNFKNGEFEEIFSTRLIKMQLPDGDEGFKAVDFQNFIYHLGVTQGSFSVTLDTKSGELGNAVREAIIKIDPKSHGEAKEIQRLKNVIDGLSELQKDRECALNSLKKREETLNERLSNLASLMSLGACDDNIEEIERLTIMMVDLAGSSKINESDNIDATRKFWGIAVPLIRYRRGKYINTWGDSLVACFDSVATALDGAWELVSALQAVGIHCRAGMHHGDVWIRYNPIIARRDISGSAVHLAARLEPQADVGTIIVSKEVRNLACALEVNRYSFFDKEIVLKKGAGSLVSGTAYIASVLERKT